MQNQNITCVHLYFVPSKEKDRGHIGVGLRVYTIVTFKKAIFFVSSASFMTPRFEFTHYAILG